MRIALILLLAAGAARADSWPMFQKDMQHTGRAAYSVPVDRLNTGFLDSFRWQSVMPGAEGASSPVFYDGVNGTTDVLAVGYHWPKGLKVVNRHTGASIWAALPAGGERIGDITPAFKADGSRIYLTNDATQNASWPNGRPLMAVQPLTGSAIVAHNGAMALPDATSIYSPTLAPDGRIFLHQWGGVPSAALDAGASLTLAWSAAVDPDEYYADVALFMQDGALRVVAAGRSGWVRCYDGASGAQLWAYSTGYSIDGTPTVDPATNHIYVPLGTESVGVLGLDASGAPLWSPAIRELFHHVPGATTAQRAQSAGCLSHDGATYYFQTVSVDGSGRLHAVATADGRPKWSVATGSQGGEEMMASPIVTQNGVVVVGNNLGGRWYAILDDGEHGIVLDTRQGATGGTARCTPSLASDGDCYLTEYHSWDFGNGTSPSPTHNLLHLLSAVDLRAGSCELANPPAPTATVEEGRVLLEWPPVEDPDGCFLRYDIYRSSDPLFQTWEQTASGSRPGILDTHYDDEPVPGTWWYAVVAVRQDGNWDPRLSATGPLVVSPPADRWAMQQRDQEHTGRAWFSIPASRQNGQLFETCRWQTPLPGPVGGSSPLFTDSGDPGASVLVGYHWPKGVQVMDRATGEVRWALHPGGGENIGEFSGAISADNGWLYLANDDTQSAEWPAGTPVMALDLLNGNLRAHSGANQEPDLVSRPALTLGDNQHIFGHGWGMGPAALADGGESLVMDWIPWSQAGHYHNGVALHWWQGALRAVTAGEGGQVECWATDATTLIWSVQTGQPLIATTTIDPASGHIYVPAGSGDVGVVGLTGDGVPLWGNAYQPLHSWDGIAGNEQRAQSGGCLSHDGGTFYFQTNSENGTGRLYAVETVSGDLKWSYETGSRGWEKVSSCPLVTPDGVVIVGNNRDRWLAVRDDGATPTLLDELTCAEEAACGSPALGADGLLFLNTRADWSFPNGLEMPDGQEHDLLAAVDLSADPWTVSPACAPANPAQLAAVALDGSVRLEWTPVNVPAECFDRYLVYRGGAPFTSIDGMEPVAEVEDVESSGLTDEGLENGLPLWYAVVGLNRDGSKEPAITAVGPRTPHWRQDLQLACLRRDPQYPRYAPVYTGHEITEPGGFGPYLFSAATSLADGQDCADPHAPQVGDPVTYSAVVRNAGTVPWEGELPWSWWLDGEEGLASGSREIALAPGDTLMFSLTRNWDGEGHTLRFELELDDDEDWNDRRELDVWSVPFKTYVDRAQLEAFREASGDWPAHQSEDMLDWLQRHMDRFNELFIDADVPKRVHYDLLQVLSDTQPDPQLPPDNLFGIFPFRYRSGEGDPRLSGYYNQDDDIDYGLLHELAHQLGLIDVYQMDVPAVANQVSGLAYAAHDDLMHYCSPLINGQGAAAMRHWDRQGHGYYGQYIYGLPQTLRMRFVDHQGDPLAGAQVEVFQYCERPGLGKVITDQVKFSGTTDADGYYTLPNVDIDESLVPATCLGDELHDNPFGYVAVVATNGVLHFRVSLGEGVDHAWLDISEANVAFYGGATEEAVFERRLLLGGEPEFFLPADACEDGAARWAIATNGDNTLTDDPVERMAGGNSLKAQTAGDYLTLIYPGGRTGRYDLGGCDSLVFWTRVENDWEFQMNAPQIRLYSSNNDYIELSPASDLLSAAGGAWTRIAVPLAGGDGWNRSAAGMPDLGRVTSIELFADTWDWAFTWWLDGLHFTPACCATDCNGNGVRDCDDIAAGTSLDENGDQIPDECQCGSAPEAPALAIVRQGENLRLSWSAVEQDGNGCGLADPRYRVWHAQETAGPWSLVLETAETEALVAPAGSRGFWRVTVGDGAAAAAKSPARGAALSR